MPPLTHLYLNNTERKQFKVCFKSCFSVNSYLNVFAQVTHIQSAFLCFGETHKITAEEEE